MAKTKKVTWDSIYADFRRRHPYLRTLVTYWHPADYATIKLYFSDGKRGLYNCMNNRLVFVRE